MENSSGRGGMGSAGDATQAPCNPCQQEKPVCPKRRRRRRPACPPPPCPPKRKPTCPPCVRRHRLKKRRYLCPGTRRYKASRRSCPGYCPSRINLCNRNWARISVDPFINFLRVYRRRFREGTPIEHIAMKAKRRWNKMPARAKICYVLQAKRAQARGFRT